MDRRDRIDHREAVQENESIRTGQGHRNAKAILYAFLAAVFYAINVPVSKLLMSQVGPTMMAALLYLGAGIGIGILSLVNRKDRTNSEKLTKKDLPFVIGMIVLDIAAPIFLMLGISYGSSANASLLGKFEIGLRPWSLC